VTGPAFTGAELQRTYDVWVPTTLPDAERASRQSPNNIWIHCLGRLKPGISFAEANVRMAGASPEIEAALPKDRGNPDATYFLTDASMGFDVWRTRLHDPLIILMAAVSLVLLLACANLANLMLARAGERRREFCIKLSLGVGRWRLLRQLLMETLALALAGCAAAILLSTGLTHYLLDLFNAGNRFSPLRVAPDVRVPLFAFAACMVTVAVAGLYPAWHAAGSDAVEGLRGASAQSGRRGFVRRCLILAQMALAIVLLFGAGIFTHSLSNLKRIDLGYDIRRVLAIQIGASGSGSGGNPEPPAAGLAEALARVRQLRVVESAAYSFPGVLSEYSSAIGLRVRDDSGGSRSLGATSFMTASPGYLATMRMTLLRGRDFTAADRAGAPPVAIVNQRFASRVWPGKEPVGMHVLLGAKEAEVVGLVADGKYQDFRAAAPRILYAPLDQMPDLAAVMSVRCRGPFGGLERDVRRIVQASAPGYQVAQVYSLEAQRDGQIPQERALAFLSSLFGALGTVLALVGIYGLISYSVTRRTQEVGVRMSVGAQAWDVLWLFARESLALTAIGMMLGLPLALILASSVKKMLFEVSTSDPLGIGVTLALITLGALAASYFPGRRATRIDPVRALRCD
jgi:predicted permease